MSEKLNAHGRQRRSILAGAAGLLLLPKDVFACGASTKRWVSTVKCPGFIGSESDPLASWNGRDNYITNGIPPNRPRSGK